MQRLWVPVRTVLGRREFAAVLLCNLLLGLAYSLVVPYLSMFGTMEVGMSPLVFGLFMTSTTVAGVVISTGLAHWSDTHWPRRTVLIIGTAAGALGYGGYAVLRDPWLLTLDGVLLLGLSSVCFSQLFAHARDELARFNVPPAEVPLYMNVFRLCFALAWTIGPAAASWILGWWSYEGIFGGCAALFVLLLVLVVLEVPARAHPPEAAAAGAGMWTALRQPVVQAHFAAFTLVFASSTMAMMNLPLLVLHDLGGTARQVGIAYSVAPVFEIPFLAYAGLLATKGRQAQLIRRAFLLAVAYYGLLGAVGAPWQVYPLQVVSAAIVAVTTGVAITFFQDFLPGLAGTATNLYSNASRAGAMAGYLLFGVLAQTAGHRMVFVVCAGFSAIGLVLLLLNRPDRAPAASGRS